MEEGGSLLLQSADPASRAGGGGGGAASGLPVLGPAHSYPVYCLFPNWYPVEHRPTEC